MGLVELGSESLHFHFHFHFHFQFQFQFSLMPVRSEAFRFGSTFTSQGLEASGGGMGTPGREDRGVKTFLSKEFTDVFRAGSSVDFREDIQLVLC